MKTFYRVAHLNNQQGLWYNPNGEFTGLIHKQFTFCKNTDLKMPFDPEIVGYLSATKTLEELYLWFPKSDIEKLEEFGYRITVYSASDYKQYKNHWLINQQTSVVINRHNPTTFAAHGRMLSALQATR
ncbi:MAG TPA: hypothetical protein VD794_07025 [Flavisolibacter sp.]|nr:hypothetical protein [Flavisolibacter sp.]